MKRQWNKPSTWFARKDYQTEIRAMLLRSTASWSGRDFLAFATEGFEENPTVFSCIDVILNAVRECPVIHRDKNGDIIEGETKALKLLNKPNKFQSRAQFIDELMGYRLIGGEGDIYFTGVGSIVDMMVLRPDWLELDIDPSTSRPARWRYNPAANASGAGLTIMPEEILVWKAFNPLHRWRGLSPMKAAARAIDTLNEYSKSNMALVQNGANPSGVLWTEKELSDGSFTRLKNEVDEKHTGSRNNRKPLLLEGGLKWQQTGVSPRDMEFLGGNTLNEQNVCKVYHVPPQVLGLPGSQTFANYEQARAALYEDAAIPLFNSFLLELSRVLVMRKIMQDGEVLEVDIEGVSALEPRRADRNKIVDGLTSLTPNEKRESMGYEEVAEGDTLFVPSSMIPIDLAGSDTLTMPPADAAAQAGLDKKPAIENAPPKPAKDSPVAVKPGADAQAAALNGAQMASLQAIVQAVTDNLMPPTSAVRLIRIAIPSISEEDAQALITPAAAFTPDKKPAPVVTPPAPPKPAPQE